MTSNQWLAKRQAERRALDKQIDKTRNTDRTAYLIAVSQSAFLGDIIGQFLGFDHSGTAHNS